LRALGLFEVLAVFGDVTGPVSVPDPSERPVRQRGFPHVRESNL
jgi:hypothetical protein